MWWKKKRIYLDTASGVVGNPSSPHEEGRLARRVLEDARITIARLLEVQADDIIFTSGATESNALAILGHVRAKREEARDDAPGRNNMHVLYLPSAHASLVENVLELVREGVSVEALPIKNYRVDTEALKGMIRPETILVAMEAVCGETGVVWNTREVAEVLRQARAGFDGARITLHTDASQAPHTEKITRDHFGADLMTLDASKVSVERGSGVLVVHRTIPLSPLYAGGRQERGLRPGTESPALAQSFATALRATTLGREAFRSSALSIRAHLSSLIKEAVPSVSIHEGSSQAPHILSLSLPGVDTDYMTALLDEAGFAVATRSACETDSETGSRAVYVLTGDEALARSTLRISWGKSFSTADCSRFRKAFLKAYTLASVRIDNSSQR
jgi:cysteine desulfurase